MYRWQYEGLAYMTLVELFVLEVFGQLVMHSPLHITYILHIFSGKNI